MDLFERRRNLLTSDEKTFYFFKEGNRQLKGEVTTSQGVSFNGTSIVISANSSQPNIIINFDATKWSKLHCTWSLLRSSSKMWISVSTYANNQYPGESATSQATSSSAWKDITLDISALTGNKKISIRNQSAQTGYIKNLWLEK